MSIGKEFARLSAFLTIAVLIISGTIGLVLPGGGLLSAPEARGPAFETKPLTVLINGTGEFANDGFGWNISNAGDVNGDNYEDIIIGAPFYDDGADTDVGAAYLFLGRADWTGQNLTANNSDAIFVGLDPDDHFGWDVASCGDINKDGFDDIIIGAPDESWGGITNGGRAHIYYGSATINETYRKDWADADETLQGGGDNERFGFSVSPAGDLNDDGRDDVIIGAPGGSYARVRFGWDSVTKTYITADATNPLWDDTTATPNYVDFNTLLNTSNTFAPNANPSGFTSTEDDGWDWDYLWDYDLGVGMDNTSHIYGPNNDTGEGNTLDGSKRLQASVGASNKGNDSLLGAVQDSCAWGVQINITSSIYNALLGNTVYIEFDWEALDLGQYFNTTGKEGTNHYCYVKAQFFKNQTDPDANYLGQNYGGDGNPEIFYAGEGTSAANDDWGWNNLTGLRTKGTFTQDVTNRITMADHYYFTFGARIYCFSYTMTANQGVAAFLDNLTMYYTETRPSDIYFTGTGEFGWDVAGVGDVSGDGDHDVIVSNPQTGSSGQPGYVCVFAGFADITSTPQAMANHTFTGNVSDALFGYSISSAGDCNTDGWGDMMFGAPGESRVYISFGKPEPPQIDVDRLWDDDRSTPAVVDFTLEMNNTDADLNTFGIYDSDINASWDGWDWAEDVYGAQNDVVVTFFSPDEASGGADTGSINPNPGVGMTLPLSNVDNLIESAAYGCQFNLTASDYNQLATGGYFAYLMFDWTVFDMDAGGATEEPTWVKARIGQDNNSMTYLGRNLDTGSPTFSDATPEIDYRTWNTLGGGTNFGTRRGRAYQNVSAYLNQSGTYYLDFGLKIQSGGLTGNNEGAGAIFQNVLLRFQKSWGLALDATMFSPENDSLGHSIEAIGKFNTDFASDLIFGAPAATNATGVKTGAVYIIEGWGGFHSLNVWTSHWLNYGEHNNSQFGFAVGNTGRNFMDDGLNKASVGTPYFSNGTDVLGKGYILGVPPEPIVEVTYPNGGEVVSGTINVNATVYDLNFDLDLLGTGIEFSIMPDGGSVWTLLGSTGTTLPGDQYQMALDTTLFPDGDYWIKVSAFDLIGHYGEDFSDGAFTIDNPYLPEVNVLAPLPTDNLNGTVDLSANATDIDGLLDYSSGMHFYYSRDNGTADPWKLVGIDNVTSSGILFGLTGWNITQLADGICYINATIADTEGFNGSGYSSFIIQNPQLPPVVDVYSPWNTSAELLGTVSINATVFDANNNLPAKNVEFWYSKEGGDWVSLGQASYTRGEGREFYLDFDTTTVPDGLYAFRCTAVDDTNLSGMDATPQFKIHNNQNNPPIVNVLFPNGGEVFTNNEVQTLRAHVVDLEDNIDSFGAVFYHSTNKVNWTPIGNDASGTNDIYEVIWDTSTVSDGLYWIKVNATDTDENMGEDMSNETFTVHNNMLNPPLVDVIFPNGGEELSGTVVVSAWAFDLEYNIKPEGLTFFYSPDAGASWTELGKTALPVNDTYFLTWDTTTVPDGTDYLLMASATDITSLEGNDTSDATFTIMNLDVHPPAVTLLEPLPGATVSGVVNLTAHAFDLDEDIKKVTFFVKEDSAADWTEIDDDRSADGDGNYQALWDTNTTEFPNGNYWVMAEVEDYGDRTAQDMITAFIIIDNPEIIVPPADNDPEVNILDPEDGDTVTETITITFNVTDIDGDIYSAKLYYDGSSGRVLIQTFSTFTGADLTATLDTTTLANGDYTIIIIVEDLMGNTAEDEVTITVNNDGGTTPGDDDVEESFLAKFWWLWFILIALLAVVIIILLIVFVTKKTKVEIRIGPFELFGRPAEGRVIVLYADRDYAGLTDGEGIGRVPDVDKNLMGKDATIRCEFGEKEFEFTLMLEPDRVIPPPADWMRRLTGKAAEEEEEAKVEQKADDEEQAEVPDTQDADAGIPAAAAAGGLAPGQEQKVLPPGDPEGEEGPGNLTEDDLDLDAGAPGEDGEPDMDEPAEQADVPVLSETAEVPEDDAQDAADAGGDDDDDDDDELDIAFDIDDLDFD